MNQESRIKNIKKIFILHGWSYSVEKWQPFLDELKKKNVTCIMLQIPGLTAPLNEVWNLDDYVAWLKKIIDQEKGKVVLLGHSNGGRIALGLTIKYPEKVSQLILVDSAGIYHNELPLRLKRLVFGTIAKVGKGLKENKFVSKLFYKIVGEHDYEKANPLLKQTMQNLITEDLSEKIIKITIPTTIVWGANDKITPVSDGILMNTCISDSTLHIIESARHAPQFTEAQKVAAIVYDSL